jgi:hypothetical protein
MTDLGGTGKAPPGVETVMPFPGEESSEGLRECILREVPVVWSGGLAHDAPTLSWRFLLRPGSRIALDRTVSEVFR